MSDFERGRAGGGDRLPWLEAVEDEDRGKGPRAATLISAVIIALIAIGLIVGGVFLLRDRAAPTGDGDLIAAPAGAYKVRPDDPGGMKVEGEGDTAFAASDGADANAAIDLSAIPETPVAGAGSVTNADAAANGSPAKPAAAPAKPAPGPAKTPAAPTPAAQTAAATIKPATPPAVKPAPTPTRPVVAAAPAPEVPAAGGTIQLGAFSSQAKADAAWKSLSGRFAVLAALTKVVTPVKMDAGTLYRLRAAAGAQAGTICAKLRVAGESCAVIG